MFRTLAIREKRAAEGREVPFFSPDAPWMIQRLAKKTAVAPAEPIDSRHPGPAHKHRHTLVKTDSGFSCGPAAAL